jgi:hypothetical protein
MIHNPQPPRGEGSWFGLQRLADLLGRLRQNLRARLPFHRPRSEFRVCFSPPATLAQR